jgi:hypothetical protein
MRKDRATYTTTLALYTSFADVSAWMRRLEAIDQHHVVAPGVYERYKSPAGAKAYHAFFGSFPAQHLQYPCERATAFRSRHSGPGRNRYRGDRRAAGRVESDGARAARRGWTHVGQSTSRGHQSGARIGSRQGSGNAGAAESGRPRHSRFRSPDRFSEYCQGVSRDQRRKSLRARSTHDATR